MGSISERFQVLMRNVERYSSTEKEGKLHRLQDKKSRIRVLDLAKEFCLLC